MLSKKRARGSKSKDKKEEKAAKRTNQYERLLEDVDFKGIPLDKYYLRDRGELKKKKEEEEKKEKKKLKKEFKKEAKQKDTKHKKPVKKEEDSESEEEEDEKDEEESEDEPKPKAKKSKPKKDQAESKPKKDQAESKPKKEKKEPKSKKEKKEPKPKKDKAESKPKKERKPRKDKGEPKPKKEKKDKGDKPKKSNPKKQYVVMTSKTKIENEDCPEFLEGKCPKLCCDKIHNYTKIFKNENNEEFARRFATIYQDFCVLEPYQKKLFEGQQLDILFIVDCTGSMATWIKATKDKLKEIIDSIKMSHPYVDIRISFVGYRDIKDSVRFEISDFTGDIDLIKTKISNIVATGGGDTPEDIAGGLKKGLEVSWRDTAVKYCILIADAPCHGEKYHTFDDDYSAGDPDGLNPEDLMTEYGTKNITFYAIVIKDYYTNRMFKLFNEAYIKGSNKPMVLSNLGNATNDLGFVVAVGSSNTLNAMTVNKIPLQDMLADLNKEATISKNDTLVQQVNDFMTRLRPITALAPKGEEKEMIIEFKASVDPTRSIANLKPADEVKAVCHTFGIKKDRHTNINWKHPFIQHSQVESIIVVDTVPFACGAERYAYYMRDTKLDQDLVGKLRRTYTESTNTIDALSKDLESITICHHLATEFNERVVNFVPNTDILLNFIHCYIYEVGDEKKLYVAENHIPGKYVKYNNNAGWISTSVADQTLLAQAFSHFTWQMTKGYLTVVDLQGVGGYLTDPQIHCLNADKFGTGNFGYVGIVRFFLTHTCNSYCRKLNLLHPKTKFLFDNDYDFFIDKYTVPASTDKIYKLCDLCRKPFKANPLELFELKKKCWEAFCESCEQKRKSSNRGAKCLKCKRFFMSSAYLMKMKRIPFPTECQKCRQETSNEKQDKFYDENKEAHEEEDNKLA